jgi:hypothetical protein
VFGIFPSKQATIYGLTIRNAQAGILNDGIVTVTNCVLSGKSQAGLFNYGAATVNTCVLSGNGDGLVNYEVATVSSCVLSGNLYDGLYSYEAETSVSNCVVSGNAGGGLFNSVHFSPNNSVAGRGSMIISDSIISDNSGPGVRNYCLVTIVNSTLSGNSAGDAQDGGGIRSGTFKAPGYVEVINSTISGNSATDPDMVTVVG